ncbi:DUF2510 domain-containing protein [Homoserinibacter sp. YIM 151385]|uniref:DUF2510 domain-containing protein n=1 Tax=Homoserinibacter sp. YIM 151385 TaxID=2985506 RepID=UPI0022F0AFD3|nr:DUF2510 domain-containing protein [Homoserinibacter sp. YIM 151385]WBU38379.1 DUF2510 domain-containing protein [Homoserinibacter sp. YIM 151385]
MTRVVPAGWYDDPESSENVRWWNGLGWTEHVERKPETAPAEAASEAAAPAAQAAPAAPAAPAAEPGAAEPAKPQVGLGFGGGYYARQYGRDD